MSDDLVDFTDIPFVEDGSPIVIDYNRPIVEVPWVPPPQKPKELPYPWPKFIECGKAYYKYMIDNFDDMFDGDSIIKHFNITGFWTANLSDDAEELYEKYGKDIQKELIIWIRNEHKCNRLFVESNWEPFRNNDEAITMYHGYNIMFKYLHYSFQLIMDDCCGECSYCTDSNVAIHFKLFFSGPKIENINTNGYPIIVSNKL